MNIEPRAYTYKTAAGCAIEADVYASRPGRRPTIVWIHGGALIMGSRRGLNPAHRDAYLAAGYHVVAIDYRLAPETKLPAIAEDLQGAFRWVRERGPELLAVDPARVAAVGHSAGGYLTLLAGHIVRPRPQALVSFYGYGDIVGAWYSRPDPFYCRQPAVSAEEAHAGIGHGVVSASDEAARGAFYLYCRQRGLWPKEVVGRDPETAPETFDAWCPVRHVTPDYPPTLLLHGDQDTDVPYAQSVEMAEALAKAGVAHELVTIPGGGHGFDYAGDAPAVNAFGRALEFLQTRL